MFTYHPELRGQAYILSFLSPAAGTQKKLGYRETLVEYING